MIEELRIDDGELFEVDAMETFDYLNLQIVSIVDG